jgi:predicted nucleic acid-binding Zn ribbon protein
VEHIGKPLGSILRSETFADGMAGWQAIERWAEIVGEEIARRARAVRFERGIVYVEVVNSSWVQELSFLRRRMVRQLNREIGRDAVTDIRFSLAGGGPARHRRGQ